ncbi:MAG: hypothetical protein UU24_C0037G0008 [Candidatus Nomurabacteria bacterium GW2011_GWA2_40_9]|uniref:Aminoglycoside phosphotransferase domain-containing protein n=1 Tax=Candidatus Nomurabacteria bacterium GW2011_GWA2_40_9 TaxID=1618734 RepID=A0A0G0TUB0_9BACT|nr:MAG: hypothetical protein UU24_C0037G0008 [Candidatus Nomurabacteria bacterium GW2011_GWA2_40_9]
MDIKEILNKYFPETLSVSFEKFGQGAINVTYKVSVGDDIYILQKMNKIIDPQVMENIEAITKHLVSKNILTGEVVKTIDGELFVKDNTAWWRMLTYIPGVIFSSLYSTEQAEQGGKLIGEFHTALLDCDYEFTYNIPHYHDTDFDMKNLQQTLLENKETEKYAELKDLGENILAEYRKIKLNVDLSLRITHQDLKISNIVFDEKGEKVLGLIDLDTLMKSNIAIEMGDALRSWCMKGGEDTKNPSFDKEIYDATLSGYFTTALFLTEEEKDAIPYGVKLISLGLSARWVTDAFNENYWVLDSSKYKTLFEQNKKRAENQFAFYKEFSKEN